MQEHDSNGDFKRTHQIWSLENFNDGYIDNKGRFRVWVPNHPRAYEEGYILRSIIAFETYHNIVVPDGMDIHHLDGNRLNDSKGNLAMLPHGFHSHISNEINRKLGNVERTCECCGRVFTIKKHRMKDTASRRGRFCSQSCYHAFPRSEEHRRHISEGQRGIKKPRRK